MLVWETESGLNSGPVIKDSSNNSGKESFHKIVVFYLCKNSCVILKSITKKKKEKVSLH